MARRGVLADPRLRPGCFVCPWAAARPRAVRAASFARRVVSKPGQAPPPPTGTAARPYRRPQPTGAAAVRAACCCLWPRWCSGRRRPRPPARLGVLTSFGAAPRSPPVPSGPSGALHTSGAGALMCGSAFRLEAWPGPAAAHGHRSLAFRSLRRPPHQWCPVAVVWFGACCYKRRQSDRIFAKNSGFWPQIDDVCNASLPSAVSPCPVGDAVAADWGGNGAFARHEAFQQRVVGVSHP